MPLTPEQRDTVSSELKRFVTDLNLSDDQKQRLHDSLFEAAEKMQEYKRHNPHTSKEDLLKKVADNRAAIRQLIVIFLTPAQLTKWDAAMRMGNGFLGQKFAA